MAYTYATLKSAIQSWTEDDGTELSNELDGIITRAEEMIYRDADLTVFRNYDTATSTVAGTATISKPSGADVIRWVKIRKPTISKDITVTFAAVSGGSDTITRASGSFLDDGFRPGMSITISNAVDAGNNATFTIASVTDTVITVDAQDSLSDETSDAVTIVNTGDYKNLIAIDDSLLFEYWPDATARGEPRVYSNDAETTIRLAPTPNAAYPLRIAYTKYPAGLSSGNTTSWLGTNAANLLFYACMVQATEFLKNWEEHREWLALYAQELRRVVNEDSLRGRNNEDYSGERASMTFGKDK